LAHTLKNLAFCTLLLCSVGVCRAQSKAQPQAQPEAKSQSAGPAPVPAVAPDDTVAYINATLHKYPSLEFVASGCPGFEQVLAISDDRRSLVLKQNFFRSAEGDKCDDVQTLTFPIFNLNLTSLGAWSKHGQHSSFLLDCTNRTDCVSRRSDPQKPGSAANQWTLRMTAPDVVSDGLQDAIQHLVNSLLDEADKRVDNGDPFAHRAQ
jgi:hypothetical protein